MGTRADFYIIRDQQWEWLGSIGWDGYPDGIAGVVLKARSEGEFKAALDHFFSKRDDVSLPDQGWPWPWKTSATTDYTYAFKEGSVEASGFGSNWFDPLNEPEDAEENAPPDFPDMSDVQNVAFGNRSGLLVLGPKP